jgi:hypothetical protein
MSFKEIYKCLRDGLHSSDASYKHLCLEIILQHLVFMIEDKDKKDYIHPTVARALLELHKHNDAVTSLSLKELQEKDSSSSD